jgi:hypothetical protein
MPCTEAQGAPDAALRKPFLKVKVQARDTPIIHDTQAHSRSRIFHNVRQTPQKSFFAIVPTDQEQAEVMHCLKCLCFWVTQARHLEDRPIIVLDLFTQLLYLLQERT